MGYKPTQRDVVIIDFVPSKGYEIRKRQPILVISENSYDISTSLVIVCPITSSDEERPFLVSIYNEKFHTFDSAVSKVNTLQVYSPDYTEQAQHRIKYVDILDRETFYEIVQKFLQNFSFTV